jgi:hypothetical protein
MFGRKQINLDMIVPTSKIALKTSCFRACEGDIDKAERLYEFFAKDLTNLPDFDVAPPTPFAQAKEMIGNAFSWLDSNQEKIAGYYQLFQQLRNGGSIPVELPNVPPIPNE